MISSGRIYLQAIIFLQMAVSNWPNLSPNLLIDKVANLSKHAIIFYWSLIRSIISNKCLDFRSHWQCTKSLISHIMSHIRHYCIRISYDMILLLVKPKNFVTAWLVNAAKTRSRHTKRALCLLSPRRPRLRNEAKINFKFLYHTTISRDFFEFQI